MSDLFEKSIKTLELPAVLELLSRHAVSDEAKARCLRLRPVTDAAATLTVCRRLAEKFTDDAAYIEGESASAKERVLCLALTPEQMTGKQITER